jgi:membrane dipeptidase
VEHIDYVAQLVGQQHVALGTDLVYFPEIFDDFIKKNSNVYPQDYVKDFKPASAWKALQPEQIINVVELLLQRGYQEKDIQGILGGNYLRVAQQVWK